MEISTSRARAKRLPSRRFAAVAVSLCISLLLIGCGHSVSGVYADASGSTQYEFLPDGKVYISVLGATASGRYEANPDRVLVSGPQGTVVLVRGPNSLHGPMGLELKPQPE